MIQAPRIPVFPERALPPPAAARRYRARARGLKGALPVEVAPRENPPPNPPPRVWLPTLPPALKQSWLVMQGAVAEAWSRELSSCLENGDKVRLRGLSFETLDELQSAGASGGVINGFIVGERRAGWMIVSAPLMRVLGGTGSSAAVDAEAPPPTRLETIMSLRAVERLLRQLNDCYLRGGLGAVKSCGRSESLKDSPWSDPENYLVSFRYTVGDPGRNRTITVAINEALATSLKTAAPKRSKLRPSVQLQRAAAAAPLEAAIVIGQWRVALSEISQLAPGDEIVMPAGEDARLEVAGRRLRRLKVKWMGQSRFSAVVGRP